MNSRGASRGSRWRGGGGWAPWKRGRGRGRGSGSGPRGASTSGLVEPGSHQSTIDFDESDFDGHGSQVNSFSSSDGFGYNVGRLLRCSSSQEECRFPGWEMYFPSSPYEASSEAASLAQNFEKYFQTQGPFDASVIDDLVSAGFFRVSYSELIHYEPLTKKYPELAEKFHESPELIINCIGVALHSFLLLRKGKERIPRINVRIAGYRDATKLRDLRHNVYGRLINVKGSVVRVSNVRPFTTRLVFECSTCQQLQSLPLPDGRYVVPTKCASHGCRGKCFTPITNHAQNESIDWQTIKIQESADEMEKGEEGQIPRTIECELTRGLVHSCIPGDLVSITGVVKLINSEQSKKARDKSLFMVYILANNIYNHKAKINKKSAKSTKNSSEQDCLEIQSPDQSREDVDATISYEHTPKERAFVKDFYDLPNKFQVLVASLCPSIYGHEIIKASLLLGLVGGCQRFVNDPSRVPVRGDPHVLVVGDPGLGKSQMLQAASHIAPRSVFVCGNTSTTAGLTVSVTREGQNGDFALEAGALVLADQGCCCIDEFDKMSTQHQALLEAMEQQCISISKSGIVASLPARCSVLAAANPIGGHYNRAKTVAENLRMSSALLSRFDLVFLLLDKPNEEMDQLLSEHVMKLHSKSSRDSFNSSSSNGSNLNLSFDSSVAGRPSQSALTKLWRGKKPLQERLKFPRGADVDLVPPRLLKSWIAFAKKYVVNVTLSDEAKQILQEYYIQLRRDHHTKDSTPITTRQLEAMIRLTEARAKLELSTTATAEHARDVVDLMNLSMLHTQSDTLGTLDFERSQNGSGSSVRALQKQLLQLIMNNKRMSGQPTISIERIRSLAPKVPKLRNLVEALNHDGHLIQIYPGLYRVESD